jgi:hypothetical protein
MTNAIDLIKEKCSWYTRSGVEGVLLDHSDIDPDSDSEIEFFPLENLESRVIDKLLSNRIEPSTAYTDNYLGIKGEGAEIAWVGVQDVEDEYRLIQTWETLENIAIDKHNRFLCIRTDKRYDWHSDLTRIIIDLNALFIEFNRLTPKEVGSFYEGDTDEDRKRKMNLKSIYKKQIQKIKIDWKECNFQCYNDNATCFPPRWKTIVKWAFS